MARTFKEKVEIGGTEFDGVTNYDPKKGNVNVVIHFNKKDFEKVKLDKNAMLTLLCGIDGERIAKVKKMVKQEGNTEYVKRMDSGIKKLSSKTADLSDAIVSGAFNFGDEDEKDFKMDVDLEKGISKYTFGGRKILDLELDDDGIESLKVCYKFLFAGR
ncbi:MAG: hypothetical protein ACI4PR_05620 [Acutalibacteraceae bacterium]